MNSKRTFKQKRTYVGFGTSIVLGLLLISFQNCSKVQPKDLATEPTSEKGLGTTPDIVVTQNDPPKNDQTEHHDEDKEDSKDESDQPDTSKQTNQDDDKERAESTAACLKKNRRHGHHHSSENESYENMPNGQNTIESSNIRSIGNSFGGLTVVGKSISTKIGEIHNCGGKIVICNAEIESMDQVGGNVYLVNSKVKKLSRSNGNIRLLNSKIENKIDFTGVIKDL